MELFILRHGKAETRAATDAQRQLTKQGCHDVAQMIESAHDELTLVTHLWVSPYLRAIQTAEIVSAHLGDIEPFITELLVPEASPALLCEQLQLSDSDALLLVSHQPLVGALADLLCGTEPGFHPMGTSSLACIDIDVVAPGMGTLRWLRQVEDI